jgi:SAM-dependent methyltransferase
MHDAQLPSAWMTRYAGFVRPGSTLLDVACGYGRHAKYFARLGAQVTAVDCDAVALASFRGVADITQVQRDLEGDPWPFAPESFDAIVVCNYLWRSTADALLGTLKPGGLLLYETFMTGNERYGKPSRPQFLLRPSELLHWTHGAFDVVAFEEKPDFGPGNKPTAMKQRIVAVKHHVKTAATDDVNVASTSEKPSE